MKYCTRCGAELVDEAVVCTKCGCAVGPVVVKTFEIGKRFGVGLVEIILGAMGFFYSLMGIPDDKARLVACTISMAVICVGVATLLWEKHKTQGKAVLMVPLILLTCVVVDALIGPPKPPTSDAGKVIAFVQETKNGSQKKTTDVVTKVMATTDDAPIEITVNVAGTDDHFLKTAIVFEYEEKNDKLGEELRRRMPKYRDILINHMSSLSYKEISDPAERDKIRKDLQRIINASLPTKMGEVQDVIFKRYLIQ